MSGRLLRWGIIGCGVIGAQHARALAEVEECQCVACMDANSAVAESFAGQHGIPAFYDELPKMLAEAKPDAVSVCTPSGAHQEVCLQAAAGGCHLLVEKPIEIALAAADRIIEACRRNRVKLGVVFQRRMAIIPQSVKRAVAEGLLGDLVLGDAHIKYYRPQSYYDGAGWRGTWALDGGGALMNQGIHTVDLLQWIMGPIASVTAHYDTLAHNCEVEDTVVAIIRYASGALGTLVGTTCCNPAYGHRLEIHGKKGTIMIQGDMRAGDRIVHAGFDEAAAAFDAASLNGRKPDPADGFPGGHALHVKDMYEAIVNDREPAVPGTEARKSLEVVLAIYRSAREKRAIELPLTD